MRGEERSKKIGGGKEERDIATALAGVPLSAAQQGSLKPGVHWKCDPLQCGARAGDLKEAHFPGNLDLK